MQRHFHDSIIHAFTDECDVWHNGEDLNARHSIRNKEQAFNKKPKSKNKDCVKKDVQKFQNTKNKHKS